ncbi:MAG: hypothetical protein ACUVXI_07675 [bacterium]
MSHIRETSIVFRGEEPRAQTSAPTSEGRGAGELAATRGGGSKPPPPRRWQGIDLSPRTLRFGIVLAEILMPPRARRWRRI